MRAQAMAKELPRLAPAEALDLTLLIARNGPCAISASRACSILATAAVIVAFAVRDKSSTRGRHVSQPETGSGPEAASPHLSQSNATRNPD